MNNRLADRFHAFLMLFRVAGVLAASSLMAGPVVAEQSPGELPAARPPAEGLDTPAATLGYALGLRIGSRIAADFKGQEPAVDAAALARGLAGGTVFLRVAAWVGHHDLRHGHGELGG